MFIELTLIKLKEKMTLNLRNICMIGHHEGNCIVRTKNYMFYVEESYEQVKELIKNEVAAERGC